LSQPFGETISLDELGMDSLDDELDESLDDEPDEVLTIGVHEATTKAIKIGKKIFLLFISCSHR
jgi:hypothetical protein